MRQRPEQRLVQQFVAEPTIGTLDKAVLLRLSGRDVMPSDAGLIRPAQDGVRGELGAIVADDRVFGRPRADGSHRSARGATRRPRRSRYRRSAPDTPRCSRRQPPRIRNRRPSGQLVVNKVQAPPLVVGPAAPRAAAAFDRACFDVRRVDRYGRSQLSRGRGAAPRFLLTRPAAFSPQQQHARATVAEPPPLLSQCFQPFPQCSPSSGRRAR